MSVRRVNRETISIVQSDICDYFIYSFFYYYRRSAAFLEKNSGILLQAPDVTEFCRSVLEGQWAKVDALLPSLGIQRDSDIAVLNPYLPS